MSTIDLPNDIIASTADTPAAVDPTKLQANFEKLETEHTAGTNTDFNVAVGTVKNMNTAVGEANTIGSTADTTVNASVANVTTLNATAGKGILPIGSVVPFAGSTAPTNFFECDGSSKARGTYASLFSAIGTAWGTADGASFNLPDLRGQFLRGYDNGAGTDPDAATRTAIKTGGATGDSVGSEQADALQTHAHEHDHDITSSTDDQVDDTGRDDTQTYDNSVYNAGGTNNTTSSDSTAPTTGRITSETRPTNANVMYIIRYQ